MNDVSVGIAIGCATIFIQTFVLIVAWFLKRGVENIQNNMEIANKNFRTIQSDLNDIFYRTSELEKAHFLRYPKDGVKMGSVFPKITTK